MVNTLIFQYRGSGSISGLGNWIAHATWPKKKKRKRKKEKEEQPKGLRLINSLPLHFTPGQIPTLGYHTAEGAVLWRWGDCKEGG